VFLSLLVVVACLGHLIYRTQVDGPISNWIQVLELVTSFFGLGPMSSTKQIKLGFNIKPNVKVTSHYGCLSREALGLSGQTLLRVLRNELKIANKIYFSFFDEFF